METFFKIYLPIYFLSYLGIVFVLPSYRTWKQTGINPIVFGNTDTAHDYIGFIMKLVMFLLLIAISVYSFSNKMYNFLLPVWYMEHLSIRIIGIILIHLALFWIIVAEYQMGNSWRIGIDTKNKTELKTTGLFSISRNPVFLGIIVSVLGLFLILPNALTFFLTVTTYIIIQVQIRLEEEFLEQQFGEKYLHYKQQVKRLLLK